MSADSISPSETDLLCESCGYTLNGLSDAGNCPECGSAILHSTGDAVRSLPLWETDSGTAWSRFLITTSSVIFHPTRFYKSITTRATTGHSRWFAFVHRLISAHLFALTAYVHARWFVVDVLGITGVKRGTAPLWLMVCGFAAIPFIYFALDWTTRLAARLTAWEASYRGYRIPHAVALRGLHYHAAHYMPVAIIALATVIGYQVLLRAEVLTNAQSTRYLYVLSGEVIAGAGYLFHTYWIGMRNMMYANR